MSGAVYCVKTADEMPVVKRQVGPLELHVDRPKGTQKTWELPDGPVTRTYPVDYGYLPGHLGEDNQPLDFFIGSDPDKGWHGSFHKRLRVYEGTKPVGFKPDETKYFAGLTPEEHAEVLKMFDGPSSGLVTGHRFFGSLPGLQGALARHRVKTSAHKTKIFEGEKFKIDRPKGFVKEWDSGKKFTYPCDYGYFPKLKGEDGEGLDAFVGDDPAGHYESFLKLKPGDDGKMVPDETKFLLGVTDAEREKIYGLYGKEISKKRVYKGMKDAMEAAGTFAGKTRFQKKAAVLESALLDKLRAPETVPLKLDERELNRVRGAVAAAELLGLAPEKTAARRGVKEMRKAVDQRFPAFAGSPLGDLVRHDKIVEHLQNQFGEDGVRKIMSGRDVAEVGKALGHGSEGVAYPALGQNGLGVLKLHDPTAPLYSPDFIHGKRQFVGHDNPNLAKIHYELGQRKVQNKPVHSFMHEYISGRDLDRHSLNDRQLAENLERAMKRPEAVRGSHAPIDVSPHNLKVTPDGRAKAVDFIGAPVSQLSPAGRRAGPLANGFRDGIDAPFFRNINEVKPAYDRPAELKRLYRARGQDYEQQLLRDSFGAKRQARKDRSPAAVMNAAKPDETARARLRAKGKGQAAAHNIFNAAPAAPQLPPTAVGRRPAPPRAPATPRAAPPRAPAPPRAAPNVGVPNVPHPPIAPTAGPGIFGRLSQYARQNPGRALLGAGAGLGALGLGYYALKGENPEGKYAHRSNPYGRVTPSELQHDNDEEFDAAPDFWSRRG